MNRPGHMSTLYLPACIIFLVVMAFMPVVETGNVMTSESSISRVIEIGLLLAASGIIVIAIIVNQCYVAIKSAGWFVVLAYAVWAMLTFLWSTNPVLSFGKGGELILCYFIAVALVVYMKGLDILDSNSFLRVIALGVFAAVVALIFANFAIEGGSPFRFTEASEWSGRPGRFYLGYSHPLETGELMLIAIIITTVLRAPIALKLILGGVFFYILLLTHGRNLIGMCPLVVAVVMYFSGGITTRVALWFCTVACVLVFVVFLLSGDIIENLPRDFWTLNNRVPLWIKSSEFISDSPFFGVGYFSSRYFLLEHFAFAGHAHNSYVEAALTTGIIGLGLMLIILFYALIIAIKSKDAFLMGMLVSGVIGGLFNPVLIIPNPTTFLLILALVAASERLAEDQADLVVLLADRRKSGQRNTTNQSTPGQYQNG
ncbi:MAG: O-antigen ligase family protein [Pseudomonadota bacterium]